jgi:hypothetical protein
MKTIPYFFRILTIALLLSAGYSAFAAHFIVAPSVTWIDGAMSPYKNLKPGDTLLFQGGQKQYLGIKNLTGSFERPIIMMNVAGAVTFNTDWYYGIALRNCKYVRLTGTGDKNIFYGFQIHKVKNGMGLSVEGLSSFVELDHIYIDSVPIGGIYAKTDPDCSFTSTRDKFTQYNTIIHDCYIAHTGDEGMYIGSSFYLGKTITCNGKDTLVYPSLLSGVKIYNNIVKYTGWDGIQVGSASTNCQIYNNLVMFDSQAGVWGQMSGIIVNVGSQCDVYNNYIYKGKGDGVENLGLGDYRIFNNVIYGAGTGYTGGPKYGIYVNDNSARSGSAFSIVFNNIINPLTNGVKFASLCTQNNLIASNAIISPGAGSNGYIVVGNPANVLLKNNYTSMNISSAGFVDTTYRIGPGSPLVDAGYTDPRRVCFDYFYHRRPYGVKFDIGIYEYSPAYTKGDVPSFTPDTSVARERTERFDVDPVSFPNPVHTTLNISYVLDTISDVELSVYDIRGTSIYNDQKHDLPAGEQLLTVNADLFPAGVDLFTLRSGRKVYTGKFYKVK